MTRIIDTCHDLLAGVLTVMWVMSSARVSANVAPFRLSANVDLGAAEELGSQ